MDDLQAEFITETRETLAALTDELLAWEKEPADRERLDAVFRFFHTVKGSCGFLALERLEALSHAAEEVLSKLRDEKRAPSTELVSAVLAIIDRITELTDALEAKGAEPDGDDEALIAPLEAAFENSKPLAKKAAGETAAKKPPKKKAKAADEDEERPLRATPAETPRSLRVSLELLDRMMSGVSEMVLARNEVARKLRDMHGDAAVETAFARLSATIADMRSWISQTRMQRIERLFSVLPRLVRDTANELGKEVKLRIEGGDVEIDREMIEILRDPLIHIARNSIDHGIEPPDERKHARKPEAGQLVVSARQSGNQIRIKIADDGRGVNVNWLVKRAVESKVISAEQANMLSRQRKLELLFAPGITTAQSVSAISGRGVGMDVVRSNIERIGGKVYLENKPGKGLAVNMIVPMTLTIISCLTVSAGEQLYAVPRSAVLEILGVRNHNLRIDRAGGGAIANVRGERMPLFSLKELLTGDSEVKDEDSTIIILTLGGDGKCAMQVGAVHDHEELVVKPGAPAIMASGLYAGTSLPDSGRPLLLLDPNGLAEAAGLSLDNSATFGKGREAETRTGQDMPVELESALLFADMEGRRRAIRLNVIERVEDVSVDQIEKHAGSFRVEIGGTIMPLAGLETLPDSGAVKLMRLTDGAQTLYLAVKDVLDVFPLSGEVSAAASPGLIEGVTLAAGRQVELIDTFWLFSRHGRSGEAAAGDMLCFVENGADDPWAQNILAPMLAVAGYRVSFDAEQRAKADIILKQGVGSGDEEDGDTAGADNVIRLLPSSGEGDKGANAVYRYDRAGLLDLIASKTKGAA